ncbi:eCIS core domain-containing protein [Flavobacterium johnsoniae]|uniref:eCIS core domain-containing protein n=1 Tax=Flavobacterium johnsoniae TaxID=986 RepID=UPI003D96D00F
MPVLTKKTNTNPSHSSSNHDKGKESFFGIQAKLNIGKSNDKFEIEADRVADQVVANKQTAKTESFFSPSPVMQKKLARDVQKQEEQNKDVQQKTAAQTITPVVQLKEDLIQNKLDSRTTEKRETNPVFSASKTLIQHKLEDKILKKEETIQYKTEVKKTETASKNILSPKPLIQNKGEEENLQKKKEEEKQAKDDEKQLQKSPSGDASPSDNSNLESKLNSSKGGGSPLSGKVKTEMESGIGADFSNVRIHNDSNAVQMNKQLGAQAFATGNNIYFNEGKYNPNSKDGKHLLAHELTHTVQQGAAIRKKPEPVSPAPEMIQGSLLSFAIPDFIKDNVRHVPGYTLLTVVAGYDPLNDVNVERNAVNLIEGFMGLIPFGTAIFDKLQEYGIIDRVFDWVNSRLSELGLSMDALLQLVKDAWDESSISTFIDVVRTKFNDLVNRVTTFASSLVDQIITWIKEALIEVAEPLLAENKAYSLLKKIIKYDPLRDKEVTATTVEILEDFLLLIDKQTELEQMREKGTLQKTADWLDTQVGTFNSLLGELRGLITTAWNAIQPSNLANIGDNLSALAVQAGGFLQRVWDFASGVALKVLELVKESLLGWLSDQAKTVRGYSLVKVIIGKDPFTQEVVPRTVPNMIKGFMSLMDGGEEQYAQMVESGAIARITGEIEAAVATLNMTPQSIIQLFTDIWDSMTIDDLVHPIDAFMRIIEKFGEPIGRLIAFVAEIVRIVIMAILEIMNFPFDLIGNIITRALEAIDDIKKDPIGFLKNILRALKQGFVQFFDNIVTHLINGVTGWLMSELKDANIPVLTDFSLKGVITWIMEVLNISMEKIWEKLAAHPRIGPARVARIRSMINTLEGIWTFIKDVQERGMAAIWDKIQEQLSNLWNTVLDAVKNFVMERILNRITARLLSMLDPTGIMAVINGAMAFFNAIQSFIKYLREMLEVVNSFVNGVADLARGNVATAADYLERTMGQAMPVVIGFLANQVGLTGIGARIGEMLIAVRQMVDEALTWLVNKAVDTGMALLDRVMAMGASARDAIFGWLGFNTPVTFSNGENHTIKIEEQNGQRVINIYSQRQRLEDFLNTKQTETQTTPDSPEKTEKLTKISNARQNYNAANVIVGQLYVLENAKPPTPAATKQAKERELRDKLKLIKDDLQSLGLTPGQNAITTHFEVASTSNGRPTLVKADPLTTLPGNTVGSAPGRGANFPPGWDQLTLLDRASLIDIRSWNRMHLIADRLHGPGNDPNNLVPADNSVNTPAAQIEQRALNKLRDPANADKVLKYETKVDYHPAPMQNFPSSITIEWQQCSVTPAGQTTPIGSVDRWLSGPINPPPSLTGSSSSGPAILNLRSASITEFTEIFGRGIGRRLQLAYSRRFLSNLPYSQSSLNAVYGTLATEGTNSMRYSSDAAISDFALLTSKNGTTITIGTTTYTIQI